jgi:ABC-type oligopeptide transport system substrate-binding subunit
VPRDPAVAALARALVKRWQDVLGVTINAREVNLSDYSQALNTHTFDLAIVRWGADFPDPQDYLGTQLAQTSNNVTGWSGHAFDDAVLLSDSYDPLDSRRRELYAEAAAIAARKLPLLPLDEPAIFGLRAPYVHGIALTPMGTIAATWTRARLSS